MTQEKKTAECHRSVAMFAVKDLQFLAAVESSWFMFAWWPKASRA